MFEETSEKDNAQQQLQLMKVQMMNHDDSSDDDSYDV